jgi:DNA-binding sugar fermentation-stimulating protein
VRHSTHSILAVLEGELWIGANPYIANTVAQQAIERGLVPGISYCGTIQSEIKIGYHRYDLCVDGRPIEVKSSSFAFNGIGVFPVQLLSDMPKQRTYKEPTSRRFVSQMGHLESLERGCLLMVVQRSDCQYFCINPLDTVTAQLAKDSRCAKVAIKIGWDLDASKKEVSCWFAGALDWIEGRMMLGELGVQAN